MGCIRSMGRRSGFTVSSRRLWTWSVPKDSDGATPIACLWARTVRCEAPTCGAEIPLMRSFWLCRKPKRKRALRAKVVRPQGGPDGPPGVVFEVFEPEHDGQVRAGTVTRAKAACLCRGAVLPPERVRVQLCKQRGGMVTTLWTRKATRRTTRLAASRKATP